VPNSVDGSAASGPGARSVRPRARTSLARETLCGASRVDRHRTRAPHVRVESYRKPRLRGASREADEGTRTLDLLHGKRVVGSVVLRRNPFVHARLRPSVRFGSAAQMFAVSRRFVGVRAAKAACCPNIRHPTLPFAGGSCGRPDLNWGPLVRSGGWRLVRASGAKWLSCRDFEPDGAGKPHSSVGPSRGVCGLNVDRRHPKCGPLGQICHWHLPCQIRMAEMPSQGGSKPVALNRQEVRGR